MARTEQIVTKRKVTARKLKLPWSFPSLEDESVADLMTKIQTASQLSLASRATLSGMAGFDWASEVGLLAAQKATDPPPPVIQTVAPPHPEPKTPPDPNAESDTTKGA